MKRLASNRAARFGIASHAGPRNPSDASADGCAMRSDHGPCERFMNVCGCAKSLLTLNAGPTPSGDPSICENTKRSIAFVINEASGKIGITADWFHQKAIPWKRGLCL